MKSCCIKTLGIFLITGFCFIISCNSKNNTEENKKNQSNNQTQISKKETLPKNVKLDSLAEKYKVIIADTFPNGKPLKIQYCDRNSPNDVKFEREFYQSGKVFIEGALENQRRTGKWTAWYESGAIWSIGYYKNGLKHGSSNVYYDNGQIKYTKNYKEDVAEGLWEFYDKEGNNIGKIVYENGKILSQEGVSK